MTAKLLGKPMRFYPTKKVGNYTSMGLRLRHSRCASSPQTADNDLGI
jgi:hypothetical protein